MVMVVLMIFAKGHQGSLEGYLPLSRPLLVGGGGGDGGAGGVVVVVVVVGWWW